MPKPPAHWSASMIEWHCEVLERVLHDEVQECVSARHPHIQAAPVLERLAADLHTPLHHYDIDNVFETLDVACVARECVRLWDGLWLLGMAGMPSAIAAKRWVSRKWHKAPHLARQELITSLLAYYDLPEEPTPAHASVPRQDVTRTRTARQARVVRSWLATRFQILKRDSYRCRLCGASPKDGERVRLEVDHITARSKGGSDDPSNLWTLCFSCNRGKGTHDL